MLLAGDEVGNSQHGNNNAYCQDNEIAWLDWSALGARTTTRPTSSDALPRSKALSADHEHDNG